MIRRFRAGGRSGDQAYSELVRRHQGWVVRLTGYLLGSFAEAEDVAQEAFVRGFTARESFRAGDNFKGWLRVIATRVAYNHRRDAKTRQRYHDQLVAPEPPATTAATEAKDLLAKVMSRLSYAYREVLVLRYVEELPLVEIASLLNLGESAAKMRLSRARSEFWALQAKET